MNSRWFTTFSPVDNPQLVLLCFHYAGGSSNLFRSWQASLPSSVQVVGVEFPGHGKRLSEPRVNDLQTLVQQIAVELSHTMDKPYAFFGHSMGALLGFELVRFAAYHALSRPRHLFVSAHKAPHLPREQEPLHILPEPEFVSRLAELNGTPPAVLENPELRELFLPIIRSDFQICETYDYVPALPLDCPLTIFGGRDDEEVDADSLKAWEQHSSQPADLYLCEGDHFFIHHAEETLLPILSQKLAAIVQEIEQERVSC